MYFFDLFIREELIVRLNWLKFKWKKVESNHLGLGGLNKERVKSVAALIDSWVRQLHLLTDVPNSNDLSYLITAYMGIKYSAKSLHQASIYICIYGFFKHHHHPPLVTYSL